MIAVGCRSNDFGTPGAKEHTISLDTPDEAARFNRRLVNACLRAHTQAESVRPGQLHVAIIGGTELSAELHRTARSVVAYGLDRIDPDKDIKITLIEAADRILPALPPRLSATTAQLLQGLGVDVRVNARVTEVLSDGVQLASGDYIPSELVVWAAGVRGHDVLANLDALEVSHGNRLVVTPTLQTTRDPDIFAIGDCSTSCRRARPGRSRRGHRPRTNRPPMSWPRFVDSSRPSRCSRSSTATSARW